MGRDLNDMSESRRYFEPKRKTSAWPWVVAILVVAAALVLIWLYWGPNVGQDAKQASDAGAKTPARQAAALKGGAPQPPPPSAQGKVVELVPGGSNSVELVPSGPGGLKVEPASPGEGEGVTFEHGGVKVVTEGQGDLKVTPDGKGGLDIISSAPGGLKVVPSQPGKDDKEVTFKQGGVKVTPFGPGDIKVVPSQPGSGTKEQAQRKKPYGLDKSLDVVVRSDESIKIGDKTIPVSELERKLVVEQRGKLLEKPLDKEGKVSAWGVHLVRPGENLWAIHLAILGEYLKSRGVVLAKGADKPTTKGYSSGVGKILKFAEHMVGVYNLQTGHMTRDLDILETGHKVVVFNLSEIFKQLAQIDPHDLSGVMYDGRVLLFPQAKDEKKG